MLIQATSYHPLSKAWTHAIVNLNKARVVAIGPEGEGSFCPSLVALTVYKIAYNAVDEKPEVARKYLKRMVGASGFEPPTSWSRTRF